MVVYLDNSFLNRPFDNPEIGTNKLESEVLSLITKLADKGKIGIVNSSVIKADIFITCDYGIIKKYKGKVKAVTPLEFIQYYEHPNK